MKYDIFNKFINFILLLWRGEDKTASFASFIHCALAIFKWILNYTRAQWKIYLLINFINLDSRLHRSLSIQTLYISFPIFSIICSLFPLKHYPLLYQRFALFITFYFYSINISPSKTQHTIFLVELKIAITQTQILTLLAAVSAWNRERL